MTTSKFPACRNGEHTIVATCNACEMLCYNSENIISNYASGKCTPALLLFNYFVIHLDFEYRYLQMAQ